MFLRHLEDIGTSLKCSDRSFEPPQSVLQLDAMTAMNGPQEKLRGWRDAAINYLDYHVFCHHCYFHSDDFLCLSYLMF